ncbi:hypothetical protein [Lentzea aerocolonigenes]|uniref:hypothetical protein n=1 Tax=Lentzea aerocolonigenes TaxID=68170 RepID=UPI0012DF2060|nr:hypothetical protein [Lentzea aerocolonigenes]
MWPLVVVRAAALGAPHVATGRRAGRGNSARPVRQLVTARAAALGARFMRPLVTARAPGTWRAPCGHWSSYRPRHSACFMCQLAVVVAGSALSGSPRSKVRNVVV